MGVTAHWIEAKKGPDGQLRLHFECALVGFLHIPGRHTGRHCSHGLVFICERLGILGKVRFFISKQ
jgi:hypothetical protein